MVSQNVIPSKKYFGGSFIKVSSGRREVIRKELIRGYGSEKRRKFI
jgi:hypothetical protein